MKVFKFGGASVKDAESVRNIPRILSMYSDEELIVIVSAMGKTTNALEALSEAAYHKRDEVTSLYEHILNYHMQIAGELFPDESHEIYQHLNKLFNNLIQWVEIKRNTEKVYEYDMYYDQIIPVGELLSTRIVSCYLNDAGIKNTWLDAREMIVTDRTYRAALVDWDSTFEGITSKAGPELKNGSMVVSQGFIGSNGEFSTSLGREGSDYSAAIFANILDAEEVVVWKDVDGYLNADPKYFADTVKMDKISYMESIELAFYGAKIIHPKTIRPLKNKSIPLLVKSFIDPDKPGSLIHDDLTSDALLPSCIIKEDQVLISISSRDFSFIAEDHLHRIFGLFAMHRTRINLMQNSAISFSVCTDNTSRLQSLISELQKSFRVRYNDRLQLVTIRHYDKATCNKLTQDKEILLEQRSRVTLQMVVK
jgi:aspartate kinase